MIERFIGGSFAFGESSGVSGSVNNQIVLYLFARSIQGLVQSAVNRAVVPAYMSVSICYVFRLLREYSVDFIQIATPMGFRVFAGITLALALYLTEHEPETLSSGFMSTMTFLYHKSDPPQPFVSKSERNFVPFMVVVFLSVLGFFGVEPLKMQNIISRFLG